MISLSFALRHHYTGQLVMVANNTEKVLIDVSSYSTSVNFEWNVVTTAIPVTEPTVVEVHQSILFSRKIFFK